MRFTVLIDTDNFDIENLQTYSAGCAVIRQIFAWLDYTQQEAKQRRLTLPDDLLMQIALEACRASQSDIINVDIDPGDGGSLVEIK